MYLLGKPEFSLQSAPRITISYKCVRFSGSLICLGRLSSVIEKGASTRWSLEEQAVDISDNGIGLLAQFPLEESQVIGFNEKMDNRTEVVAWSRMIDEENCRAGVKFA